MVGELHADETARQPIAADFIPGYTIGACARRIRKSRSCYRATSTALGRDVALKISKSERSEGQLLAREYAAVSTLRHPAHRADLRLRHARRPRIPRDGVLSARRSQGAPAAGRDRAAMRCATSSTLPSALRSGARAGLLHRDLKPPNVMLREDDDVALIDFGLARNLEGGLQSTRTGVLRGSPYYMSPEQALGEELDPRTDLYSLGVIFYEMLTGAKTVHRHLGHRSAAGARERAGAAAAADARRIISRCWRGCSPSRATSGLRERWMKYWPRSPHARDAPRRSRPAAALRLDSFRHEGAMRARSLLSRWALEKTRSAHAPRRYDPVLFTDERRRQTLSHRQACVACARTASWTHSILVPGAEERMERGGVCTVAGYPVPGTFNYRLPLNPRRWCELLDSLEPDLIEAGDAFHPAWCASRVAQRRGIPLAAFYHSNLPQIIGRASAARASAPSAATSAGCTSASTSCSRRAGSCATISTASACSTRRISHSAWMRKFSRPSAARWICAPSWACRRETRLLVYAGRFAGEKNVPVLLQAFARLGQPYHLLLIGGEREARPTPNITLLPYRRDSIELAQWLASADALVHAGTNETFGLVILEAMACGRPVVAARAGAIPEIVDEQCRHAGRARQRCKPGCRRSRRFTSGISKPWVPRRERACCSASPGRSPSRRK